MRYFLSIFALMLFFGIGFFVPNINGQEKLPGKFLSVLNNGQFVNLSRADGKFTLDILDDNKFSKVIEVGNDYIVIEDFSTKMEIRIPITSILEIRKLKKN